MLDFRRFLGMLAGVLVLVVLPANSQAGYVYLNGVPAGGLKNQKFQNCTVVFDAKGNVQITAPGVKIKAVPQPGAPARPPAAPAARPAPVAAPATPPPPMTTTPSRPPPRPAVAPPKPAAPAPPPPKRTGPLTQRYFLIAIPTVTGIAQFDVDVFINKQHVRKVRNRESQVTFELTKYLRWGRNEVQFAATKNMGGKSRKSSSETDLLRLVIGPGIKGGGTVKLSEILADFRAPASKVVNFGATQHIDLK